MLCTQSTTKEYIRTENKLQSNSKLFIPQVPFSWNTTHIISTSLDWKPRKTATRVGAHLYSVDTQHRNLHPARWPILLCRPTQEPLLDTANTGKTWERFWKKKQVNGAKGKKSARKKSLSVSITWMAIHWATPGFKERTFKLCVLNRRDFNFCVRSSPLRGCTETQLHSCTETQWQSCRLEGVPPRVVPVPGQSEKRDPLTQLYKNPLTQLCRDTVS